MILNQTPPYIFQTPTLKIRRIKLQLLLQQKAIAIALPRHQIYRDARFLGAGDNKLVSITIERNRTISQPISKFEMKHPPSAHHATHISKVLNYFGLCTKAYQYEVVICNRLDVNHVMMGDYRVEMINDGMKEFPAIENWPRLVVSIPCAHVGVLIGKAGAGGSPSLVARGFSAHSSGIGEQLHIQVPNEKVGVIIGKGSETIKTYRHNLEHAFRTVRVTGDRKQIEMAREMLKEVMDQIL
ncbi:hypothetical protein L1987_64109 [Smallanthus sonchifolius]|uniref:Uncharacterized protein n=1 Tax=Smallanthus sonchifolius TaxID=185202 RepID=A0ACB9CFI6_9ASTR|nr:hypothetical protein L1987_64109 [Smallanthus sonchifolius]